eukprot:TRINITY_DN4737_c0_g1_i8.p1 TRINITY_DN4737_c0_g1~~TRINITY_DN4737_c0_g1_i8.p1  ORF type:complete len:169 (+),score=23.73 TRINITY_DN4737_c0_g1_i8:274-780(+)
MLGNVYVRFSTEEQAEIAMKAIQGRFYHGQLVLPEYSPVSDFREARCRQYDEDTCGRGGYCNFMHLKRLPRHVASVLRPPRRERLDFDRGDRDRGDHHRGDRRFGGRDRSPRRDGRFGGGDRRFGGRDRSPRRRSPSRERDRSPKNSAKESDEERRLKIQQWNRERQN